MTSSFKYRLGFVFILHVWIIICVNLVNSHENNDNAAAYNSRIRNIDLRIFKDDDILAVRHSTNLPQNILLKPEHVDLVLFFGKRITTIPENTLQNLGEMPNLYHITIRHLNVTELPEKLFSNLISTRVISIEDNNNLQTLPPFLFKRLKNLEVIHLRSNGISTLSRQQFGNLINLKHIEISNSPLRELSADLFKGLTSLTTLYITNCSLTSVTNELFRDLINLEYIQLDHNKLTELPEDLFHGLEALDRIHINNNQLISLPERIFSNLRNLRFLHFDNNKLTQLSPNLFVGLQLKVISVYNNQLTSLSSDVLENQNSILTLDLTYNFITELPLNVLNLIRENKAAVDEYLINQHLPNFQRPSVYPPYYWNN